MPQIMYAEGGVRGAIAALTGASHYRLIGISLVQNNSIAENSVLLETGFGNNGQSNTGYIVVDRCVIRDTNATHPTKRTIWADSELGNIAVIDSYLSGAKSSTTDAQDILVVRNPGPILIRNNYLEGGAENINFCGSNPGSLAQMPKDITIQRNLVTKPAASLPGGYQFISKSLIEFKCGLRVLVEGNTLQDIGYDNGGTFMRLTVRAECDLFGVNETPWMELSDLTIRYNIMRRAINGFNTFPSDDHGSCAAAWTMHSKRWNIHDNLIYDIDHYCGGGATCGYLWLDAGGSGDTGQCTDPPCGFQDLTFRHNTGGSEITLAVFCIASGNNSNLDYRDNLIVSNSPGFGVVADCGNGQNPFGVPLLNSYFTGPSWTWTFNLLVNSNTDNTAYGSGSLPVGNGNLYPTSITGIFTNAAADDYTIPVSSAAHLSASDGKDLGVDFTALYAAL